MTFRDPSDGTPTVAASEQLLRLGALALPGHRDALLLARGIGRSFTVDEAAAALGCHRSVARRRLDHLEVAGYLAAGFRRPEGRGGPGGGRPAKWFRVAPELEVTEFPSRRYAELAGLLVDELRDLPRPDRVARLRGVGRRFAELLSGPQASPGAPFEDVLRTVVRGLGAIGYSAWVAEVSGDRAVLAVPTCTLRPAVISNPDAAEIDRGMWAGLVEAAAGRPAGVVECATEGCMNRSADCRVTLLLRSEPSTA